MVDTKTQKDEPFTALIGLIMLVGFVVALIAFVLPDRKPLTPEQAWGQKQAADCRSIRGEVNYDTETGVMTCWRTPFMRHPKIVWERKYEGPRDENP